MAYEIILKASAQKDLDKLPDNEIIRIVQKLELLSDNPRIVGIQKLSDDEWYRIRIGKYRVLFRINDSANKIEVYRIKHRKDVYK